MAAVGHDAATGRVFVEAIVTLLVFQLYVFGKKSVFVGVILAVFQSLKSILFLDIQVAAALTIERLLGKTGKDFIHLIRVAA